MAFSHVGRATTVLPEDCQAKYLEKSATAILTPVRKRLRMFVEENERKSSQMNKTTY